MDNIMSNYQKILDAFRVANQLLSIELDNSIVNSKDEEDLIDIRTKLGLLRYEVKKKGISKGLTLTY
jgi:hypothetical protein